MIRTWHREKNKENKNIKVGYLDTYLAHVPRSKIVLPIKTNECVNEMNLNVESQQPL